MPLMFNYLCHSESHKQTYVLITVLVCFGEKHRIQRIDQYLFMRKMDANGTVRVGEVKNDPNGRP